MAEKKKTTKKTGTKTKKKPGGRPTVMTKETVKKLEEAFILGYSDEKACFVAGITRQTLHNYCQENPKFFDRKELLKSTPELNAKKNIAEGIKNGDVDLSKWYLERKCKDEFSTKQDVGVSGSINNPFESLTTEELKKLVNSE